MDSLNSSQQTIIVDQELTQQTQTKKLRKARQRTADQIIKDKERMQKLRDIKKQKQLEASKSKVQDKDF